MKQAQTNQKSQAGKAVTNKTMFSRETTVSVDIKADPSIVWALITRASDYPKVEFHSRFDQR